ncbi:MAG: hypothetical protein EA365_10240 [Gloeocapsa sp. DLM2.Bin57]|nr:MAG: hypothetical protein EA365_10240 [Gloeocapsa sp. DLM2.Bin57]
MSDLPLLIHIGYPKTASSWLQADIFNNQNTGFCVPWLNQEGLCNKATDLFINCDVFSQTAAADFFLPPLTTIDEQLIPVLSNEFLSGCFFFTPPNYTPSLPREIPERLHCVFPNAKVLIMIREQKSMLVSAYRQMLIMGHSLTIEEFINTGDKNITKHPTVGNLENLKFDELIEKYQQVFTPENVLVLPLEILIKDKSIFFKNIYNFLKISEREINNEETKNVGLKGGKLTILRILNSPISLLRNNSYLSSLIFRINYKLAEVADPFIPKKIHDSVEKKVKNYVKETVGTYYQESNQKTSQIIGIDLAKLGYTC